MQPAQTSPLDCMREIRLPTSVGALSKLSQIPTPPSLMRLSATRQWTPLLNPMPNQFEPLILFASMLARSEEHTSELQSHHDLVCRLLLEKKKNKKKKNISVHIKKQTQ